MRCHRSRDRSTIARREISSQDSSFGHRSRLVAISTTPARSIGQLGRIYRANARTKHSAFTFLPFAFSLCPLLRDYLAYSEASTGIFRRRRSERCWSEYQVVIDERYKGQGLANAGLSEAPIPLVSRSSGRSLLTNG